MNGNLSLEEEWSAAEYTCPRCGRAAGIRPGRETAIVCPDCGETAMGVKLLPNGDIEYFVAGTGEPYELDPGVRSAEAALAAAEASGGRDAVFKARADLAEAYSRSGREVRGEGVSTALLEDLEPLAESGDAAAAGLYFEQVSTCAAYAVLRGRNGDAVEVYKRGCGVGRGSSSFAYAEMLVNYGYLCGVMKHVEMARDLFSEALGIVEAAYAAGAEDPAFPFLRATLYDSMRSACAKDTNTEEVLAYLRKSIAERKRLLSERVGVAPHRVIELADAMSAYAEYRASRGERDEAEALCDEAVEIARAEGFPEATSVALVHRAKVVQGAGGELPESTREDMDYVVASLSEHPDGDPRSREMLAQAYMFRSATYPADDYDSLLADIGGSFEMLMELAEEGCANELFLMSAARSYLVLLGGKEENRAKAKEVRARLSEYGISQKDLDSVSRKTLSSVGRKSTRVRFDGPEAPKPVPGRRLVKAKRKRRAPAEARFGPFSEAICRLCRPAGRRWPPGAAAVG